MTSDGLRLIQDLRRSLVEPAGRLLPAPQPPAGTTTDPETAPPSA